MSRNAKETMRSRRKRLPGTNLKWISRLAVSTHLVHVDVIHVSIWRRRSTSATAALRFLKLESSACGFWDLRGQIRRTRSQHTAHVVAYWQDVRLSLMNYPIQLIKFKRLRPGRRD